MLDLRTKKKHLLLVRKRALLRDLVPHHARVRQVLVPALLVLVHPSHVLRGLRVAEHCLVALEEAKGLARA